MKKTRALAGALALSMLATLTACDNNSGDASQNATTASEVVTTTAGTTKPQDESIKAEVEALDVTDKLQGELENKTIKWFAHFDLNANSFGKDVPVSIQLFENVYGGKIEWISTTWETRYSDMSTYVLGGEGIDFFSATDQDGFPMGAQNGMFVPADPYIDWSSELWSGQVKDLSDRFKFKGSHYVICTQATSDCVVIYNKDTISENGLDDPLELYREGKWDWNTYKSMLEEFCDAESECYGLDGFWTEKALMLTTGTPLVSMENDQLVLNMGHPNMERAMEYQYDLFKSGLILDKSVFDWAEQPHFMGEGKELFYNCGFWTLERAKEQWSADFGENVMFVPMPKDPEADKYYLPAGMEKAGFLLCKGGQNPEGVIKYIECLIVSYEDEKAQEITDKLALNDYGWTQEMLDMLKEVNALTNENPVYDFYNGISEDLKSILDSGDGIGMRSPIRGHAWSEVRAAAEESVEAMIEEFNTQAIEE